MDHLSSLLTRVIRTAGITRQVEAAQIVDAGNRQLVALFGDGILAHAACFSYQQKEVCVVCTHSVLAQDILERQEEVIGAIVRDVPHAAVDRIVVRHRTSTDRF
ncbi:hypothetical protein A3B32_03165 [Candidatus Uhrbacteria bacterium RIFCSPLOWO2_01_FULL_53_9]|uniref:Uncharacterized protein n=3 Tax=Candidatus Uhriibacteriota TaxID=1752732 RepID=A0A1F7UYN6_9BACT|nr:MAG: hypothetical protein A3C17_01340 [Candidatus Uhrbacteria bacterium RIFCSPHIGHO2_02_FULL_53_13]OGL83375.1 MAG: hypothetical protein A3B32_03165 [Candidatus Uhrbacteria bacterium RIFCSPLOWO2_01_FULL_53_9]OGL90055.1 MAG: hypothetical protein A3I45_04465 [Candidatus Uhrbacteria bacterium RIFCSPLOWO2_02_FULL_53_10]